MNNREHIDKMTDNALNSLNDAGRATPKPYLLTRINARLNKEQETLWESAGRFIARPAVVICGLCLIIGINVSVIAFNNSSVSGISAAEQLATPDDFANNVATLYDIENNEP